MFNLKRLLILLISILFIVTTETACLFVNPGKEMEAQEMVDDLIEEGPATMNPTPTPIKVGLRLTDDEYDRIIKDAWIPVNWEPEDFGTVYAIHANYDTLTETSRFEFEYHSTLPASDLRVNFGEPIYQLTPPENYHSCVWVDEKNNKGEPLETTLNIVEMPDYNAVYIAFIVYGSILLVPDVFNALWPQDAPITETMTSENNIASWFSYYPETKNIELGKVWYMQPGEVMTTYEWYWDLFKDTPGVDDTPEEPTYEGGTLTPRIGFQYDVFGDGSQVIRGNVKAYEQADLITLDFILEY